MHALVEGAHPPTSSVPLPFPSTGTRDRDSFFFPKKKQMETLPLSSMCDTINRDLFALCVAQRQAVVLFFLTALRFVLLSVRLWHLSRDTRTHTHTHAHTRTPGWVVLE